MRIAFIGTRGVPATYSGFETCVEQVGARMVERGHHVTVFCRSGHYRERKRSHKGMSLRYLPAVPQKHLETLSHTALSAIRLPRDTAIVCMGVGNAPVVRMLEAVRRRCVFNVDGADWQREKWGGFATRYLQMSERTAARSHSLLVADAAAVQRYYMDRFGRRTELVPYGAVAPEDRGTSTLDRFGLRAGEYMLFVGRLVPENAAHDILAAAHLADIGIPAVVVGDATYADDYIAGLKASAAPTDVFTGFQFGAAYQQLSSHAGIFVLPATVGGTHPVLVEQMAAGNCILARDTESNREVLGESGVLWKSNDDLANALRQVWADPGLRRRLGDAARTRAAERYDWEAVTDKYIELCGRTMRPG